MSRKLSTAQRRTYADGKAELEQIELAMRLMPVPMADKAASIDAIHALLATLPNTGA